MLTKKENIPNFKQTHALAQEAYDNGCVEIQDIVEALTRVTSPQAVIIWLEALHNGEVKIIKRIYE